MGKRKSIYANMIENNTNNIFMIEQRTVWHSTHIYLSGDSAMILKVLGRPSLVATSFVIGGVAVAVSPRIVAAGSNARSSTTRR